MAPSVYPALFVLDLRFESSGWTQTEDEQEKSRVFRVQIGSVLQEGSREPGAQKGEMERRL